MKALVIIDMQVDFVSGSLGSPEAQAIVPNVVAKLQAHKNTDTVVLFTKDTHKEDYLETTEGKNLPVEHCIIDTPGWSIVKPIHDEFKNEGYKYVSAENIVKGRILKSTFGSYDLLAVLNQLDLDEIELCGLVTDICLVSNAIMIRNFFPDVPLTVDSSCCAGTTVEAHEAALQVMRSCQINVI